MKFQTLRTSRRKRIVISVGAFTLIILTISLVGSHAKYRATQSIPIAKGTIKNYKVPDLNVVAMYQENDAGTYDEINTVPTDGYELNTTKSYCGYSDGNGGITKDSSVTLNYSGDQITIGNIKNKGTKCYVYFDKTDDVTIAYDGGNVQAGNCNMIYSIDNGISWNNMVVNNTSIVMPLGTLIKTNGGCMLDFCSTPKCSGTDVIRLGTAYPSTSYKITGYEISYYNWICFTEETTLLAYDEKKKKKLKRKVKDLQEGDYLYTFDEKTKKYRPSKIKKIEKVKSHEVYAITIGNEIIRCSRGHRFYVVGVGSMMAQDLKETYKLLGADNQVYEINKIDREYYDEEIELYNIYLEDNNNCLVGDLKIISYLLTLTAFSLVQTSDVFCGFSIMIDVIIPVYEAEQFLNSALTSLLNQTIKDKLLITLVDDGSKQKYDKIIEKFNNKLNIQIIKLKKNYGQGYAKQKAVEKTKNQYIFFMDADDKLIRIDALELLLNEMNKEDFNIVAAPEIKQGRVSNREEHMVSKLFRREFISENKIKVPNYLREEDVAFSFAAYSLSPKDKIKNINETIYEYCKINPNSVTEVNSALKGYACKFSFKAINYAYKYCKKYNKYDYFKERIYIFFLGLSNLYLKDYLSCDVDTRESYIKNCQKFLLKYNKYFENLKDLGKTKYSKDEYDVAIYFYNILKNN